MNSPAKSKINYTAMLMSLIGVAAALGWIPEDLKEALTEATLILMPQLIVTFRTFFTDKRV